MRFSLRRFTGLGVLLLGGCGNPGPPEPPSLMLPAPVHDLSALRTGNAILLSWTMTGRTTDKLLLKKDQTVSICRAVANGPCLRVGQILALPDKPAHFEDTLSVALTGNRAQLLRYEVRLLNHAGRDAGVSNSAYSATGTAPPAVQQVSAATTAKGILIRWTAIGVQTLPPSDARLWASLQRERLPSKEEKAQPTRAETAAGVPQPLQQTLEAAETAGPGAWAPEQTLDANAILNRTYRYSVQLMQQERIDGHLITVRGAPVTSAALDARDIFPPPAPEGLDAAANPQGKTIDLSWTPDSSPANIPVSIGYFVYRRTEKDTAPPARVSGAKSVSAAAWSDPSATPGIHYAYSVSAIDANGKESSRSAEIVAELPTSDQ
jgi:hypothetical protein